MTRCIVSCAYSEGAGNEGRYHPYGRRLEASIAGHGYEGATKVWYDSFPPGSPAHRETHYAFKYWAVKWARDQGHDLVMWLDSAVHFVGPVDALFIETEGRGVLVIEAIDILGEWISDQALARFGVSRDAAMEMRLTGGCVVGIDFRQEKARRFFDWWGELAATKLFVSSHSKYRPDRMRSLQVSDADESVIMSEDPRFKGHRSDEACFALMLRSLWIEAWPYSKWHEVARSGYTL